MMTQQRVRSMKAVVCTLAVILLFDCLSARAAGAQGAGELSGSVYDEAGAAVARVQVSVQGAVERRGTSSAGGEFSFRDLPEGDYEVVAELSGFEPMRRQVQVQTGERSGVSFTMRLAILEQTVVTAARVGEGDVQTI